MTEALTTNRDDVLEALERGVESIIDSDSFRSYLDAQARFHRYSVNNTFLIYAQRPDATNVASYKSWAGMGRQVMKGEKGIRIFVPFKKRRDPDEPKDAPQRITGFGVGSVFDISQTEGDPLPDPPSIEVLTGESETGLALRQQLVRYLSREGVMVAWATDLGGARGRYSPQRRGIEILEGLSHDATAQVLAHEAAHAVAKHDHSVILREDAEAVAECAAYIVCSHVGIDAGAHTFPYVAGWVADRDRFRQNVAAARETANVIIAGILPE